MSTLHPPAGLPSAAVTRRAVAAPAMESVAITWSISRQALRGAMGRPEGFAIAERGEDLELRWTAELDGAASAVLLDPASGSQTTLARGACTHVRDGDLLHVEVRDGGEVLLAATLRVEDSAARVLYARTTLLAKLGLGGGRYEVA